MTILANTPEVRRLGYSGLAAVASADCAAPALRRSGTTNTRCREKSRGLLNFAEYLTSRTICLTCKYQ